jgi:acetyl-CoA carboxylase biotin carboxyl carrier protein
MCPSLTLPARCGRSKENLVADDSAKTSGNPGPFDVRTVKNLVALMAQHDLSEIDLRDGTQRLRLRRGGAVVEVTPTPMTVAPAAARPAAAEASAPAAASAKSNRNLAEIKSETVGTFYTKPSPEAQPFVTIGSKVTPTTQVCTIEAMKTYSPVEAGVTGTIVEICAKDGLPVEFNQVLFRVEV